jgi:ATP-binding cassette, subfamily F, member 3
MITVEGLSKQYSGQTLFENINLNVNLGEKIGLVGRNGHGKTTLLRLILGQELSDEGRVIIPKNYKIGYLSQHINFTQDTVLEEVCLGLPENKKNDKWQAEKILSGLGFSEQDFSRSTSEFSGGYQLRINFAKVLVSDSNLLLLDEPTNFLDIISIRWLEGFLNKWQGEYIIISHDRNFMDKVTTHIIGINRKNFKKIQGKTSDYYSQIAQEEEVHEKQRINQKRDIKQMEAFVNRFRAKARRASQAQARQKKLQKMERIDKLNNVEDLFFAFNYSNFEAKVLLEAEEIKFSYTGNSPYLVDKFNLTVRKDDKIGIIGINGAGKTTLLKLLSNKLEPINGKVRLHPKVQMACFDQENTVSLEGTRTVEEEIISVIPVGERQKARNICGTMMFSGDDALKRISVLSGGEKCRVLLGRILAQPSNLLVLDEPTHHLDMQSCDAIIDAVKSFEGAALFVTHDEYFLHKAANKLVIFSDEKITIFPGTYAEFLERIGWEEKSKSKEKEVKEKLTNKERRQKNAGLLALRSKTLKPYEQKIDKLEHLIEKTEKELSVCNEKLIEASHNKNSNKIMELSKNLHSLQQNIDSRYEELEILLDEYEKEKEKFEN